MRNLDYLLFVGQPHDEHADGCPDDFAHAADDAQGGTTVQVQAVADERRPEECRASPQLLKLIH